MVDRQSIANDLNAIANAVTRGEELVDIHAELDIVQENIEELSTKGTANDAPKENVEEGPKENEACGSCEG